MKAGASEAQAARKMGRPLSFDRDAALEQAMLAFWRHGYETTSITDLTDAMGITAPSLYTAFGNKQQLFLEAARRYADDPAATAAAINGAPTALEAARALLTGAAVAFTGQATPPGCLLASATASGSAASASVQAAVTAIRRSVVDQLRDRITRDVGSRAIASRHERGGARRSGDDGDAGSVGDGTRQGAETRTARHGGRRVGSMAEDTASDATLNGAPLTICGPGRVFSGEFAHRCAPCRALSRQEVQQGADGRQQAPARREHGVDDSAAGPPVGNQFEPGAQPNNPHR